MNAKSNDLLHRLEQATSAGPVDPKTLDEETAMLRENWLSLGKLLKAADVEPQQLDVVELRYPAPERRKTWQLAWTCVASALAVAGLWFILQLAFFHDGGDQDGRAEVANHSRSDGGINSVPTPVESPITPISGLAWDDGWENDFAQTALALQHFHGEQGDRDSSMSRLQDKFQELALEFESGSL